MQIVNILSFEGLMVSVMATELCYSMKTAIDYTYMNSHVCVPLNFIYSNRWQAGFGPQAIVC